MSSVQYNSYSPYYQTQQTSWYLDVYTDIGFVSDSTDETVILPAKYNHRPDLLAYDLYGTSQLWYLFYLINDNINDPIFDLVYGMEIVIPQPSRVKTFFGG